MKALETKEKWFGCLAFSIFLSIVFEPTRLFAIHGVNYLLPFFLMGYGIRRYSKELFTLSNDTILCGYGSYILYTLYFILQSFCHQSRPYFIKSFLSWLHFQQFRFCLIFVELSLFFQKLATMPLEFIFLTRSQADLLKNYFEHLHIDSNTLIFVTYLSCAIFLSIGFTIIMEKFNFTRKYIMGIKSAYSNPQLFAINPQTTPLPQQIS